MAETLEILLVDDDAVDRLAVRRVLQKLSLSVQLTEAADAETALQLLKTASFDCVLLDYQLPGLDGLALLQTLRRQGVENPLIMLTGQGDEQIAVSLMKAGAADYLTKDDLTPETLQRSLQSALRLHQAERAAALAQQRLEASNRLLWQQNQALAEQQRQIQQKNQQLLNLAQLKDDFVARLTHDLRTPLVAANRMLQLCLQGAFGEAPEAMADAIANIITNNQNLLSMTNTLLEVYRHEADQKSLSLSRVCLWELAETVVRELAPLATEKALELTLKPPDPEQDCALQADRLELRRVLTNLVGNAIKFTESGTIQITVAVDAPDWLQVAVTDTGPGIAEAEQVQLFQRFRPGNSMRAGSGLGLHLSRRIAEMHGGSLTVDSHLGQGSTFTLRLPARVE
jgi:signal transduction histidine kinase